MARFIIEIETVDATPEEWVDALAKVRGLPHFELSEPTLMSGISAIAEGIATGFLELAADMAEHVADLELRPSEAKDMSETIKNLTCSAYSAMRLVGGAK